MPNRQTKVTRETSTSVVTEWGFHRYELRDEGNVVLTRTDLKTGSVTGMAIPAGFLEDFVEAKARRRRRR